MNQNLDWLNHFAKGLELLDDYDHENLDIKRFTKGKANYPGLADYQSVISSMRSEFDKAKKKTEALRVLFQRSARDLAKRTSTLPWKKKPLPFFT